MDINKCYDTSQIKTYIECPFKYYLKFVIGLQKKDKTNMHLEFGRRVHKCLEELYRNKITDTSIVFDGYEPEAGEDDKTVEGGIGMISAYAKQWGAQDQKLQIIDIEKSLELPIGEYKFLVKVDTIVKQQGCVYSLEHKTSKMPIRYNYSDNYYMDQQMTAQVASISEHYEHCSGVILNVLALKCYKRKTKDKDIGFNYEFNRYIIDRTKTEVDNWKYCIEEWIKLIEKSKEKSEFTKCLSNTGCNSYSSQCQFAELCKTSVGMNVDEQIVENMYEFVDPLDYLKEEL